MKKEILTKENIIKDLLREEKFRRMIIHSKRDAYILPLTLIALILGFLFKSVILTILFSVADIYHIVRLILELKEQNEKKKAMLNGDFSVSSDVLNHIAKEEIYEPYLVVGGKGVVKQVNVFYFGGGSWCPLSCKRTYPNFKHYKWSDDFAMTNDGLINTSVKGNGFYVVIFEGEIVYAYNDKFFEYKE